MVSATNGADITTGTLTVYVTGDGGTQATGSGTNGHKGNGSWNYVPTQAETNYDHVVFTFVITGAISVDKEYYTTYPQSGDAFTGATLAASQTFSTTGSVGSVTGAVGSVTGAVGSVTGNVGGIAGTITTLDALNTAIPATVWDTTAASHITAGTMGAAEVLGSAAIVDTTITGTPTSTTIQLTAGSTLDNFYNDQTIYILSGTGIGQARVVTSYVGATKTITVDEAYITTPAAGARVAILVGHVHPISQIQSAILSDATPFAGADIATIKAGVPTAAQLAYIVANAATGLPVTFTGTGTTTTGTLALVDGATPSAVTDQYKGRLLVFNAGTLNQCVTDITGYNGTTKVVTVTAVPVAIDSTHTARLI